MLESTIYQWIRHMCLAYPAYLVGIILNAQIKSEMLIIKAVLLYGIVLLAIYNL